MSRLPAWIGAAPPCASTLTGARRSLVSACDKADDIENVLCESAVAFEERSAALMKLRVSWWGRTTCFDVLLRAGALAVSGETYRPDKANLRGSQGPSAGFERLWGVRVTVSNADLYEELLRRGTQRWDASCLHRGSRVGGKAVRQRQLRERSVCVPGTASRRASEPRRVQRGCSVEVVARSGAASEAVSNIVSNEPRRTDPDDAGRTSEAPRAP